MYIVEVKMRDMGSYRVFPNILDAVKFAEARSKNFLAFARSRSYILRKGELSINLRVVPDD